LNADDDIDINADITSTAGILDIILDANRTSGTGVINLGNVTLDGNGGTITATGETVNINTGATINSDFSLGSLVLDGVGTLTGTGNITLSGLLDWRVGNIQGTTGAEQLNANGGISLTGAAQKKLVNRILNNNGTTNMGPNITMSTGAVFNNLLGSTVNMPGNSAFTSESGGGTVNNIGSMVLTGSGAGSWGSEVLFNNTGSVDIQDTRTLFITTDNSAIPHTGDFNIAVGATYRVNMPTEYAATSDITGSGTMRIENGGVGSTLNGSFDPNLKIILANFGKINFNFDAEVAELVHSNANGGTIGGTGSLKVLNTWTPASPDITINGTLILGSGINTTLAGNLNGTGTLINQGSLTMVNRTINSSFDNQGTLNISGTNSFNGTVFDQTSGTIALPAGATLNKNGGAFNWIGGSIGSGPTDTGTLALLGGATFNITGGGARILNGPNVSVSSLTLTSGSLDL